MGVYILQILLPACLSEGVSKTKRERVYFCKKYIIHTMILVDSCWANHLVLWYVIPAFFFFFFFFFFCSKSTGKILFDFPQSNWNAFKVALLGISTSLICLLSIEHYIFESSYVRMFYALWIFGFCLKEKHKLLNIRKSSEVWSCVWSCEEEQHPCERVRVCTCKPQFYNTVSKRNCL